MLKFCLLLLVLAAPAMAQTTYEYEPGTWVHATATAADGWWFVYWADSNGAVLSIEATLALMVDDDMSVKPVFVEKSKATLSIEIEGSGTVDVTEQSRAPFPIVNPDAVPPPIDEDATPPPENLR